MSTFWIKRIIFFIFSPHLKEKMKSISKQKAQKKIITGLMLISLTMLTNHYLSLPDFFNGLLFGTGIGMLILGVFFRVRNQFSS